MQLCIHIGLHKTGSTSFQMSAFNSANKLAEHGIIYPISGSFIEGIQHLRLAKMLRQSEFSEAITEIKRLSCEHPNAQYIILSSEELGTAFAEMNYDACVQFTSMISTIFSRVSYFGVARSENELIRSGLREYIEAVGVPKDGIGFISTYVEDFFRRLSNLQSRLPHLQWVDFEKIKGHHLAKQLISKITSIDVDFETTTTNRTADKTLIGTLLLSQLRLLHFNAWNEEHVYTDRIRLECEAALTEITIDLDVDRKLSEQFDRWLDQTLAKVTEERARVGAITKAFHFSDRGVHWSTVEQSNHPK